MKKTLFLFVLFGIFLTKAKAQFITTWQTTTANESIIIPTTGGGYNYTVDWGDGSPSTNETGNATHVYSVAGDYSVTITGAFPRIYFNNTGDKDKISSIDQWGTNPWTSMNHAFWGCSNLVENATDAPDLTNVTDMNRMFMSALSFNQDISNWIVTSSVTSLISTFQDATLFNQDISNWNVSNVTNMNATFLGATSFNQPLDNWDVGSVTNMIALFSDATSFNQSLNNWNVSNVTLMNFLFNGASSFNGNISNWDVSNVVAMNSMFGNASSFNQDISGWNVSNVTNMGTMFSNANIFNQNIGAWDVSNVNNMSGMLQLASNFDQDLGGWIISSSANLNGLLYGVTLSTQNYDSLLINWSIQTLPLNTNFYGGNSKYCATTARQSIIDNFGWTITDGGEDFNCPKPFVTTWKTDNQGTSNNTSITIPTTGSGYNYDIDWNNDGVYDDIGVTGSITHDYGIAGTYTIAINGDFPRIYFNNSGDKEKILSVEQWGDNPWISMAQSFYGCSNLVINATDTPNLSGVTSLHTMFAKATSLGGGTGNWNWDVNNVNNMTQLFWGASSFNQDIGSWSVGNVITMQNLFLNATAFNQGIGLWDVSNVNLMESLFNGATAFNQDIGSWNVSSVTSMWSMFYQATNFNQDISSWNVSSVNYMVNMFGNATSFNQNIGSWNVSGIVNMQNMFLNASSFDQNIDSWNVGNVTNMANMFYGASSFNQDIGSWDVGNVTNMYGMLNGVTLSTPNYDSLLIGWETQSLQSNINFHGGNSQYCAGATARQGIINNFSWTIADDGEDPNCTPVTYVPDDNFEQALIDLGYDSGPLDDYVPTDNINTVTTLDVISKGILDLTGIEDFIALTALYCASNQLTNIDVSQNLSLTELGCSSNQISSLDVSFNTNLTTLNCHANQLTNLDVTQNIALTYLSCYSNQLTSLDIAQNTSLSYLDCSTNQLSNLNVINNTALTTLRCDTNQLMNIDVTQNTLLVDFRCYSNQLTNIDVTQNTALTYLSCYSNQLMSLDTSQNTLLESLFCYTNQLTSLDVTQNTSLEVFFCHENQLSNLDVTQNTGLISLSCSNNQLTSLDVNQNTSLETLFCFSTLINDLDLSLNTSLTTLFGYSNQLYSLNMKNGNNTNVNTFIVTNNPNLNCIEVDDNVYSTANWTNIDSQTSFSEDCSFTPFVTIWKTDNSGTSNSTSITIPIIGTGYNYDVDWDNDGIYDDIGVTGNITHDYGVAGTYTVVIRGDFPRIYFQGSTDKNKLLSIEQWGDIVWTTMERAFIGCSNLTINATDAPVLSNVTNMSLMFSSASNFNQDINHWDVSTITDMSNMFNGAIAFNQSLNSWNVNNVTNMESMFRNALVFNGAISNWNVGNVVNMSFMFYNASAFNQSIGGWNVGNATTLRAMFQKASVFNQDINSWDVSNVTNMHVTFAETTSFNQPLNSWNVSSVIFMRGMFGGATVFNQPLNNWNVSSVVDMYGMFQEATSFNQDIGVWNVSSVSSMNRMFAYAATFNQNLNSWNVSNVTDMYRMFADALLFNQPLDTWDVNNVASFNSMFSQATSFNQDLGNWHPANAGNMYNMFEGVTLSTENYDALLIGWSTKVLPYGLNFTGGNSQYCAITERQSIIDNFGWNITDGGIGSCLLPDIAELPDVLEECEASPTAPTANNGAITATSDLSFPITTQGNHVITWTYDDGNGNTLTQTQNVVIENNDAPIITSLTLPIDPVDISQQVNGSADFVDENLDSATWDWGDSTTSAGLITGITITGGHSYANPGVYEVSLTLTDICGLQTTEIFQYVVVYNPNGGFVTGGGWITSPIGAYVLNPSIIGKANFGFVSKYKKGKTVPDGNTEFQFQAAGMNFKSTSYDWLIIAGTKAMFKGDGTINGQGNYGFILSAKDENKNGGDDTFRIKIWDNLNDSVVYDNQLGDDENADATTVIGAGSIIVHKAKGNNASRSTNKVDFDETYLDKVKFWPNPSEDFFTIKMNTKNTTDKVRIHVLDITGKLVHKNTFEWNKQYRFGDKMAAGVYFVKVTQASLVSTIKVIKK